MDKFLLCTFAAAALAIDSAGGASLRPSSAPPRPQTATDSTLRRDAGMASTQDPWLLRGNAAALTRYEADNLSWAEAYMDYGYGGFVNYDESPRSLRFGAGVQSFCRLSHRTVAYGRIGYDNASLHAMTGSVFIAPDRYPFNIVEDSLAHPGKVHQDTYRLTGAVGTRAWRNLSLGARVDFTAANAAKYRDLRHKNKLMDIDATAGAYLPIGGWISLGANYRYLRHSESLQFSTYGRNDATYKSLIEYGAMMGEVEQFGNDGFTGRSFEQPLFFDGHGYGVQAELRLAGGLTWYNAWDQAYLHGYYGKDSPYNILFTRHHTHRYQYAMRLQLRTGRNLHRLDATVANEKLDNHKNQYLAATNGQGARHYVYYQPLKTADKVWVNSHIGYTGCFGIEGETPTWQVALGTRMAYRKLTAYAYPYYRRQHWESAEGYASLARNLFLRQGILTLEGAFSYRKGSGEPFEDGTFIQPSDRQAPPPTMEAFLYREYASLMAPQYALQGAAQYAFVMPGTRLKSYARADYAYRHCNRADDHLQGRQHWSLRIAVGVNF